MLLEMLAGERSGELALYVGPLFDRDITADRLCASEMAVPYGADNLLFTHYGRHVAERLADQLVERVLASEAC